MLKNTQENYGSLSKLFHWTIFVLVTLMLLCGFFMEDMPESIQGTVYMCHKSTGILILGLMILRIFWRLVNITPELPEKTPVLEKMFARLVQILLYLSLLMMPVSGWILSTAAGKTPVFYGLITMPFPGVEVNKKLAHMAGNFHEILAYTLLILIGLHIAGALKHHFIDRDKVLKRMM